MNRIILIFFLIIITQHDFWAQEYTSSYKEGTTEELMKMSFNSLLAVRVKSASLFKEDEMVVGSSVSHIKSHDWEKIGAKRLDEAIANENGLFSYPTVLFGTATAFRGYASGLSVRGTAYIIDGIPLNTYNFGTNQYVMPQVGLGTLNGIEIVKGPNSTIYGSDAFQGVIAMNTFEADSNHYSIQAAGAHPSYMDANLKVSQGLWKNKVRFDIAASENRQSDLNRSYYFEHGDTAGYGIDKLGYNNESVITKMSISPTEQLKVKLGYYLFKNDYSGSPFINAHSNSRSGHDYCFGGSKFQTGKTELIYTLKNKLSFNVFAFLNKGTRDHTISVDPIINKERQTATGETRKGLKIHLKQPIFNKDIQWLIGVEYNHFKISDYVTQDFTTTDNGVISNDPYIDPREGQERDIIGYLGQIKWGIVKEKFYILSGIRYDVYSDFGGHFTPKLSLIYLPTPQQAIKAIYSRGFRASTIGEQIGNSELKGDPEINPETIDSYELVFLQKTKTYKVNLTGFYTQWEDAIQLVPITEDSSGFNKAYKNYGKNISYGIETSLSYYLDPMIFELGYSYVDSKALIDDDVNQRYAAFPKHSLLFTFTYLYKPWNLHISLLNRWYGDWHENTNEQSPQLDTYWRTDLNIKKQVNRHLDFTLNIRNLLDRENYIPSVWGRNNGLEEQGIGVMLRVGYTI